MSVFDHFTDVGKMVQIGSEAQNGDSRKKVIALAQTYFAIQ